LQQLRVYLGEFKARNVGARQLRLAGMIENIGRMTRSPIPVRPELAGITRRLGVVHRRERTGDGTSEGMGRNNVQNALFSHG